MCWPCFGSPALCPLPIKGCLAPSSLPFLLEFLRILAGNSWPVPLESARATFREQLSKTSQLFPNSLGFGQLLSVVISVKTFYPKNLLSLKGSGTAPQLWSQMMTSCKNHHVGMRSESTRMPLGFSLLIFHMLVWYSLVLVAFPLNYLRPFSSSISDFSL